MRPRTFFFAIAALGLPVVAYAVPAPHTRISMATARAKALHIVPHASVKSAELEHERGKWVYSFDLGVAGRPGIEEVQIDAMSGTLVSRTHESPAKEAQETRAERPVQKQK
jgi:hypothetical protein